MYCNIRAAHASPGWWVTLYEIFPKRRGPFTKKIVPEPNDRLTRMLWDDFDYLDLGHSLRETIQPSADRTVGFCGPEKLSTCHAVSPLGISIGYK